MFYSKRTQIGTVWYNMVLYGKVRKYLYYKSGQLVKAFVGQKLDNVDRAFCPNPPSPFPPSREEVVADIAAVPDTSFPKDWLTKVQCTCHGSWYISIMMMETGGLQDAGLLRIVDAATFASDKSEECNSLDQHWGDTSQNIPQGNIFF